MRDKPPQRELHPLPFTNSTWFFNVDLQNLYLQSFWDGTHGLSSLSENIRKSNHLQKSLQKGSTFSLVEEPKCWCGWGLNQQPPARQTNTFPELAGRADNSARDQSPLI